MWDEPFDAHQEKLLEQVRPSGWANPRPSGRYNLVAIGAGAAGLVSSIGTAGLGGKAALVERHRLGGDCLNYGCVPSKALIAAAHAAYEAAHADRFGCRPTAPPRVDFAEVMRRMRALRAQIAASDSAARFTAAGVDVYFGPARFVSPDSIDVDGSTLRFDRAAICTGGRPAVPPLAGIDQVPFLTNESVFSLTELPRRLLVLGAGPIGCELAQVFRRFGGQVDLVGSHEQLLPKEDPAAAEVIAKQFGSEGIAMHLGWHAASAEKRGSEIAIRIERSGQMRELIADALLLAAGRKPNVEELALEAAGIAYGPRGVTVDDWLRTSNPRVYAAGDVIGNLQFTHAADAMARIVLRNALFFGRQRFSRLVVPRATYTSPEVAHVGLTASEARERGVAIDSVRVDAHHVDRLVLDDATEGFAVVHVDRKTGKIAGATIVGPHAGEMIGEITLLMTLGKSLSALASTIHCYPTQVEILKRIADQHARTRLTPRVSALFRQWLAWRRRG